MAQIVLTPTSTVPGFPVGPYTLTGGATVHAVLADSSDASYLQTDDTAGLQVGVAFPAPSLPANGAFVTSLQLRMRRSVNAAAISQQDPFWWFHLEVNDNGFLGTGVNIQHHERVMGPELTPYLDGTTAIQTTTTSVISWFDDGAHVRDMRFGDARFILLVWPTFLGGGPQMRLYKLELLVNYNSWPVATVSDPVDPINSSKPLVKWAYSDADNDNQTRARVVIVKPNTPSDTWPYGLPGQFGYQADGARTKAWDSGDLYTGGTEVPVAVGLTNGQQYYAYVRVWAQPVASTEQKSYWFYKLFTVTATGPAVPTFTVTTDPTNSRNLLTISESTTATPHPAYFEVERLDPGQTFYTPVRGGAQTGTLVGSRVTSTGVGWSTPDRADMTFASLSSFTWYGRLTDYTPAAACTLLSKGTATGNQREFIFRVRTDGKLEFTWSTAGTSYNITATSTVASSVTDNTDTYFKVDAVTSTNPWTVSFFKSTDGVNWTQIGTSVTGAGPQSIFGSTGAIYVGGIDAFTSEPAIGLSYEAKAFNQSLALVAHPVIKGQPPKTTSFIDEVGNTWTYTSGANGYNQAQLVIYDYEAPIGVAVTYEARSWRDDTDVVPSAWVTASGGPWTLPATQWLLKDPLTPANNMTVKVIGIKDDEQKPITTAMPIGADKAVVTHTGVKSSIVDVTFRTLDQTTFDKLRALLRSGRTLLLQGVLGRQWYVQPGDKMSYEILKASPSVGETFPIRHAYEISVTMIEVEAPA